MTLDSTEHVTYPNPDRVGRCEFAVKTILGLALLVPCLVMGRGMDRRFGIMLRRWLSFHLRSI